MIELNEQDRKQFRLFEFVETISSDSQTQNTLLESLTQESTGRFNSAEEMFNHIKQEWENEETVDSKE